jgi:hypothetical protein
MNKLVHELKESAATLSHDERAELALFLLNTLDGVDDGAGRAFRAL